MFIHSASQLLTLSGGPQRGQALGSLGIYTDGAALVRDGMIEAVGPTSRLRQWAAPGEEALDASGCVVMPGLVDAHTHIVWAGDRAAEFEMRLQGMTYLEIQAAGGGILSTVAATRSASPEQLLAQAQARAETMFRFGTTTAEAKTGYGLTLESELRQLQAILELDAAGPLELAPTFLGAHTIPPEYQEDPEAYVDLLCAQILPGLHAWWKAHAAGRPLPFVDVFCDVGAFDLAQARRILEAARALGFPLKVHADEFAALGASALASELGAISADHLVASRPEDIAALAASGTAAVALPGTPFGLNEAHYTPAREILRAGGLLAIASDLNPGTAWCESMQFVIALACRALRLTPAQAIAAATINAAAAIGRADRVGSLEPGKQADLLVLNIPDYRHLGYRFGANLVKTVIKKGRAYPAKE